MKQIMMHEQLTINDRVPVIARHYDYDRFTYPWHFHSEYEIIYFAEGEGRRFVADSCEPIMPGDVIMMGCNVPHYMCSAPQYYEDNASLRVKGVIIQFACNYMAHAIGNYTDMKHIRSLFETAGRGICFPHPANAVLIESICALPGEKGVKCMAQLLLLLDQMARFQPVRMLGTPHFNWNAPSCTSSRMEKVLSYIHRFYAQDIKLSTAAACVSMNASAFSRYFKEKSGKSFVDYIQYLRIGYACRLLSDSMLDVLQISIECGFNTPSHFNRIFKRSIGLTPTEYRQQFRNLN
ncbi:MAG: AraC family transcriptional regulator [Tannerella sp.]|nr:AraC family transcriptional regulator [Tannerella sp.]